MNDETEKFTAMIEDAGIPTTQDGLKTKWNEEAAAQGSAINNDSKYSPFWRLVSALISAPALWMIDLLITHVLPNAYVKTASGVYLELLAWAVDIERKQAVTASGKLQFTRFDGSGTLIIPVGVTVQTVAINGVIYEVVTTEEKTMLDGETTALVAVDAIDTGSNYSNYNLAAGYYSILPTAVPGVSSVTNLADWLLVPGADVELDDDLRERVQNQFGAVGQWHTDAVYTAIISSFDGVKARNVFFEHNAPRGPGTANGFIMLDIGTPDAQFIANIQAEITDNGNHGHGDDLVLFAMPESLHVLTVDVWPQKNLTDAKKTDLENDVINFIRCAFRENVGYSPTLTFPLSQFSFSKLGCELHKQFSDLYSVDFIQVDIVSNLELPRIDTLTVNML
ncbi:MAG: baseplate J/gp47 family protein [Flavobacteriales bacterium]|nr:baseplate J/gp47 family protein [Flavobacteriales bacterium]